MIWVRSRTAVTLAPQAPRTAVMRAGEEPGKRDRSGHPTRHMPQQMPYGIAAASSMMSTERSTRR